MVEFLRQLWAREPVRVVEIFASVAVFALSVAGVVVDEASVVEALLLVLPVLLGGELARSQVSPSEGTPPNA